MNGKWQRSLCVAVTVLACGAVADAALLGGLAGLDATVTWGDDLIDNGYVQPYYYAGDPWYVPDLLLNTEIPDYRWDYDWGDSKPNNLSMTFNDVVNVTEVSLGFRWWYASGPMIPTIELYRDAAHTQLVSSVLGSSNEANGVYTRYMSGLDETLNTLYFKFLLPPGQTDPYANDLVMFGEVNVTGTVIPEPVSVGLILAGGVAVLRRKR